MGSQGVLLSQDKRWKRTPPTSSFSIDWSHPLTRGLEILWMPALSAQPQYMGTMNAPVNVPNQPRTQFFGTKFGRAVNRSAYVTIPSNGKFYQGFVPPASVAWAGRYIGRSTGGNLFGTFMSGAPYDQYGWYDAGSYLGFFCGGWGTATGYSGLSIGSEMIGDHVLVGTAVSGDIRAYVDGALSASSTQTLVTPGGSGVMLCNNYWPDATPTWECTAATAIGVMWSRVLTEAEVAEFSANPFCFLRY